MKMKQKGVMPGAVITCAAMLLLGWGSTSSGQTSDGVSNPTASLTIAVAQFEPTWDPAKSTGSLALPLMKLAYDGLTTLGADGSIVPQLATKWTTKDKGKSYTFTLRSDAKFSNGDTFDAADAKATLDRYRTLEFSTLKSMLSNIEDVIVEGPTTLRVVQKRPDVTLPALLADRPGVMLSQDAIKAGDVESKPIGTGMFVFNTMQAGVSITFSANPAYWDKGSVKVAKVTVKKIEDAVARANALRSGDLDMSIVSANQYAEIAGSGKLKVYRIKGRELRGITFNPKLYKPLEDQRVRDALSIAINREGLAAGILLGEGEAASQFVLKDSKYYSVSAPKIEYNPKKAKALLREAGYESKLAFTMTSPPKFKKEAESMQADWAAIGVKVNLIFPTGTNNAQKIWYKPEVPVGMFSLDGRNDLGLFYAVLFDKNAAFNPSGIAPEDLTALIAKVNSEPNEADRKHYFDEIAQIITTKTQIQSPLAFGYNIVAYSSKLTGVSEWPGGFPYLHGVGKKAK
jgi:peptide/nickel transport system substrate-binding protein